MECKSIPKHIGNLSLVKLCTVDGAKAQGNRGAKARKRRGERRSRKAEGKNRFPTAIRLQPTALKRRRAEGGRQEVKTDFLPPSAFSLRPSVNSEKLTNEKQ